MKKIVSVAAGMLVLSGLAFAQDEEFTKWMKVTGGATGSLKKDLDAQNYDGAVDEARKLEGVFKKVAEYWDAKGDGRSAELAKTGQEASAKVVAAASVKDSEQAVMGLKTIQGTCKGCHEAHREKAADGTYKIK
jgi:cytochrome c553